MKFFENRKNRLPREKTPEELDAHFKNLELEKGDIPAMMIAAFLNLILPLLLIVGAIFGVMYLFAR